MTHDPVTANMFPGKIPANVNPRQFIAGLPRPTIRRPTLPWHQHHLPFPERRSDHIGGFQTFNYILNFNANGNGLTTRAA